MNNHFIYFMETDKYIKIGITKNIKSRIKQVQTGCPTKIHTVSFSIAKTREVALLVEKKIHELLDDYNTFGKWFYHIKSNLYKKTSRILSDNNCSIIKLLYEIENIEEDISESIVDKIERVSQEDTTFSEKIQKLSRLYNKIQDSKTTFIALTRAFVLKKCRIEINRQKNFIKKEELLIAEEARGQAHIEFANSLSKSDIEFQERKKELTPLILKKERIEVKKRGNITNSLKTDTLKDAELSLSKCMCGEHLKIIKEIEYLYPHLSDSCNKKRNKIENKMRKAFSKIPTKGYTNEH